MRGKRLPSHLIMIPRWLHQKSERSHTESDSRLTEVTDISSTGSRARCLPGRRRFQRVAASRPSGQSRRGFLPSSIGHAMSALGQKRTSEGDHTLRRGQNQRSSTSRAIPTRSRHNQAAIDSLVIARRRIAEIPRLCCLAWAIRNCAASIASSKSPHL
jgi:hypothetical protein